MEVTSLAVIESVGTAGSRGVVAGWLVSKAGECEAVGVEEGRREAPRFIVPARRWIRILDFFMVTKVPVTESKSAKWISCDRRWCPQGRARGLLSKAQGWERIIASSRVLGAPGRKPTEPSELRRAHR